MRESAGISSAELVITVPEPFGAAFAQETGTRTTLGVLIQLIVEAQRRIILAAPFLQEDRGLSDPRLSEALRSKLQHRVTVNIVSTGSGLQTLDLRDLSLNERAWLRFYRPHTNLVHSSVLGSHAKFCLADYDAVLVTSANFTGPALEGQLEMGVLGRGSVARQVANFWDYCLRNGVFVPVEPSSLQYRRLDTDPS